MKRIMCFTAIAGIVMCYSPAFSQKDEEYYFKLGRKYIALKDTAQALKHFEKCMALAEKNKSETSNYYYYPMFLYFYGHTKVKTALKAADLITKYVPEAPFTAVNPKKATEQAFINYFKSDYVKFDKSDYLFLRYFLQFKTNSEIEIEDVFNRMHLAVKYHDTGNSIITLQEIFKLTTDIYSMFYKESSEAEKYNSESKQRLCDIFYEKSDHDREDAKKIVQQFCK